LSNQRQIVFFGFMFRVLRMCDQGERHGFYHAEVLL